VGTAERKNKRMNAYVIIFYVICFVTVMTWIIPAGSYERVFDEATGRTLVVPGTYRQVEATPVDPVEMITCIFKGFEGSGQTIFFTFFAFAYIDTIFKTGAMSGAVEALRKFLRGRTQLIIPVFMVFFMMLGTTSGCVEATYGMIPAFIGISIALGYDAMVGLCIVELATFTGFYCSLMNPFTVGIAQTISELPLFSGMWYRVVILVVIGAFTIWYTMRYAAKVKADPSRSIVADIDYSAMSAGTIEAENVRWTWREKCTVGGFACSVVAMMVGSIWLDWNTYDHVTMFIIMFLLTCVTYGMSPNEICENFIAAARKGIFASFLIGLSRGVLEVLEEGNVVDTVFYYLSGPLVKLPGWLGAQALLAVQMIVKLLIPSGTSHAATTMPIMAPLSDLIGVNRQVSVLAYMFGGGWTNLAWPTSGCVVFCAIAGIPYQRWLKFWWKPGLITLLMCVGFIALAHVIGYGPF